MSHRGVRVSAQGRRASPVPVSESSRIRKPMRAPLERDLAAGRRNSLACPASRIFRPSISTATDSAVETSKR